MEVFKGSNKEPSVFQLRATVSQLLCCIVLFAPPQNRIKHQCISQTLVNKLNDKHSALLIPCQQILYSGLDLRSELDAVTPGWLSLLTQLVDSSLICCSVISFMMPAQHRHDYQASAMNDGNMMLKYEMRMSQMCHC